MNVSMRPEAVRYIVLHCTATRSNASYPVHRLTGDHRQRGFRTAGYHFYVRSSGEVIPLRPTTQMGAHARGYNRCSIAVCYEGGLSPEGIPCDTRTPHQHIALTALLRILKREFPTAEIVGHRDLSPDRDGDGRTTPNEWIKACPCFDARTEYASLTASQPNTPVPYDTTPE